jgi:ribonuclease P protein component
MANTEPQAADGAHARISSGPSRGSESLSRSQRITRSREFQEAYDQGLRYHGRFMVLWLRKGDNAALRLGVVASRRVGNAVQRARAKRRMREVYRRQRGSLQGSVDVVLVARQAILDAPWDAVTRDMAALAKSAGLTASAKA